MPQLKALVCEFMGSALLLSTVVGSGILSHRLDMGNVALTVFFISVATGACLSAAIFALGQISAHFNPVVTLATALRKELSWSSVMPYWLAQTSGALTGVMLANLMFGLPMLTISETARFGPGQWLGEFVATFGLLGVIFGCARSNPQSLPIAVPFYVVGAIMFTSSTCFANPAVTISRIFTGSICGISPASVPAFVASQLIACFAAVGLFGWLFQTSQTTNAETENQFRKAKADSSLRELVSSKKR